MLKKNFALCKSASIVILIILLSTGFSPCAQQGNRDEALSPSEFIDPPQSARPTVWWDWLEGNVELDQLTRDLEELKDKGLGGAEIWDVAALRNEGKFIPPGPAFLSQESVQAIRHALREGKRLGLRMGMMAVSGWNAGGSWIRPEEAGKALYISKITVHGSAQFSGKLPFPKLPEDRDATYGTRIPRGADGLPLYYRDIAVLAFPQSGESIIRDMNSIIDLSGKLGSDGILTWDVPPGDWVILRFVCSNTGQQLICASPNSNGPFIDFLDPDVTRNYLNYILDRVLTDSGDDSITLDYLFLDSMELGEGIPWTGEFRNEFLKRRGYDPLFYLPALAGWKVRNEEVTGRFIYDLKKTTSDLLISSHYESGSELLHERGLEFAAEAGGPGPPIWNSCPVDALKALGAVDILRGEFWIQHKNLFLIKQIASAAHIYGKKIVDAESFTTWRRWKDAPFDYKKIADRAFCEGLNQLSLVTFAHSPAEAGKPGWTLHAGSDFNPNITWWHAAKPFMDYLARCCHMLQQGLFVGDVCYYYGDQAPNFYPAYHDVPEKPVLHTLGVGYDYDVVNTEVILTRMDVRNGRIVLPDGMNYELLVLPEKEDMPLDVLEKLELLVREGAIIAGPKPVRTTGLSGFPENDEKLRRIAAEMWGPCDGQYVKENSYGKGKVYWGKRARDILRERGTGADFEYVDPSGRVELDYIHRRTADRDIYFIRNKNDRDEEVDCIFRVRGMRPELWDPATGEIRKNIPHTMASGGTALQLRLSPGGSVFVVFGEDTGGIRVTEIRGTGLVRRNSDLAPFEIVSIEEKTIAARIGQPGTYDIAMSDGTGKNISVLDIPEKIDVEGPWEINFPSGWGAPPSKTYDRLISWTDDTDEGIRYFSGTAVYCKKIMLTPEYVNAGIELYLDLGNVGEIAELRLNGKPMGILWKHPFRMKVTDAVRLGVNELEVSVTNLWSNRLAGDMMLPPERRFTRTNQPPYLSDLGEGRIWEPLPSGLMGPVHVLAAKRVSILLE